MTWAIIRATVDLQAYEHRQLFQQELAGGESILWNGQPSRSVIFHASDFFMIPFSLLWGGFALVWEVMALVAVRGSDAGDNWLVWLFPLWGVPFVIIGQYMIWGRFIHDSFRKKRTHYAVTNRRVLILELGRSRKLTALDLATLPAVSKSVRSDGIGTIRFSASMSDVFRSIGGVRGRKYDAKAPELRDVDDAEQVYQLILDHQKSAQQTRDRFHTVYASES